MKRTKRIGIVSGAPVNLAPYLTFYTSLAEQSGREYIILNTETSGVVFNPGRQVIFTYPYKAGLLHGVKRSIAGLRFVISNLVRFNCKRIVVSPTRTGLKLFLLLYLFMKDRYIFDIRDYTCESRPFRKWQEDCLIKHSYLTVISSRGFMEWVLPSAKVKVAHNIPLNAPMYGKAKNLVWPVTLGYVGLVAYPRENQALIQQLKNDSRYNIVFFGEVSKTWNTKEYLELNRDISNVSFMGPYLNSQKAEIYTKVDMILCLYGAESPVTRTALPNKLYDCAIYRKPIIVSTGTYLAEVVEEYGLGCSMDILKDDAKEVISEYIDTYDPAVFDTNCKKFLEDVLQDQEQIIAEVTEFFRL